VPVTPQERAPKNDETVIVEINIWPRAQDGVRHKADLTDIVLISFPVSCRGPVRECQRTLRNLLLRSVVPHTYDIHGC
jgi:hypothetical protein